MLELRERAQGLVEYGLIIALVAVLAIAGLIIFGPAVRALLFKAGRLRLTTPRHPRQGPTSGGEVGPFFVPRLGCEPADTDRY